MHCISPLFVVYGTDWGGSWQLMRPVNLIPKSASDGFATLLFRAFSEVCFKCGASVPPPKAPHTRTDGENMEPGRFTLEVVTVKPLINTEFTTSLATQLPVESSQCWMSNPQSIYLSKQVWTLLRGSSFLVRRKKNKRNIPFCRFCYKTI